MRAPEELPDNQITPVARGIDAFLRPKDYQIAKPMAPLQTPAVKGITQVGTNSVGSYAGYNPAEQLATSLAKFNPALTNALQTAGVAFAGAQMNKADQEARAAAAELARAQALLDSQTELSAEEYAAESRKLAIKDPYAGGIMHQLNPYRSWGWQRGMAYSMGQKLKTELPTLAADMSAEDYLSPDQGMSKLMQLRNAKLQQMSQMYGVSEDTPSYQNYVLKPFNQGSDSLTSQVMKDRVKWMDSNQPVIISNNVGQLIQSSLQTGQVDVRGPDGTVYTVSKFADPTAFRQALESEATRVLEAAGAVAGKPGQRGEWTKDAYLDLIQRPAFAPNSKARAVLDNLKSNVPLMGTDGKQMRNADGEPLYRSLGQAYMPDALEIDNKLQRDRFNALTRNQQLHQRRVDALLMTGLEGLAPGPEKAEAARQIIDQYVEARGLDQATRARLYRDTAGIYDFTEDLENRSFDPDAGVKWRQGFEERVSNGTLGTKAEELQDLAMAAADIPQDQREQWYRTEVGRLNEAFKGMEVMERFPSVKTTMGDIIKQRTAQYYPLQTPLNKPDVLASQTRQRLAYTKLVEERLRAEEARLGRDITPAEAQEVAAKAMNDYGTGEGGEEQRRYLYPGSNYPNSLPSTSHLRGSQSQGAEVPVSEQIDIPEGMQRQDLKAKPVYGSFNAGGQPVFDDLDGMPERQVRARSYQTEALIDIAPLGQLVLDLIYDKDKKIPAPLLRLMRDAKVQDPFTFIDAQLKLYPNFPAADNWTPQQYEQLRRRLQSSTAVEGKNISTTTLERRGLTALARLDDWPSMA